MDYKELLTASVAEIVAALLSSIRDIRNADTCGILGDDALESLAMISDLTPDPRGVRCVVRYLLRAVKFAEYSYIDGSAEKALWLYHRRREVAESVEELLARVIEDKRVLVEISDALRPKQPPIDALMSVVNPSQFIGIDSLSS